MELLLPKKSLKTIKTFGDHAINAKKTDHLILQPNNLLLVKSSDMKYTENLQNLSKTELINELITAKKEIRLLHETQRLQEEEQHGFRHEVSAFHY